MNQQLLNNRQSSNPVTVNLMYVLPAILILFLGAVLVWILILNEKQFAFGAGKHEVALSPQELYEKACETPAELHELRSGYIEEALDWDIVDEVLLTKMINSTHIWGADAWEQGQRPVSSRYFLLSAQAARDLLERRRIDEFESSKVELLALPFYNEACAYVDNDETRLALNSLEQACELGLNHIAILTDEELDPLRGDSRFEAIQYRVIGRWLSQTYLYTR